MAPPMGKRAYSWANNLVLMVIGEGQDQRRLLPNVSYENARPITQRIR